MTIALLVTAVNVGCAVVATIQARRARRTLEAARILMGRDR